MEARRPARWSSWVRQENPSARTTASRPAARTAGRRAVSATATETSWWPRSAPKLPASPQQPPTAVTSAPPAPAGQRSAARRGRRAGGRWATTAAGEVGASHPARPPAPRPGSPPPGPRPRPPGRPARAGRARRAAAPPGTTVPARPWGCGHRTLPGSRDPVDGAAEHAFRRVQLARGDPGETAAQRLVGEVDPVPGVLETRTAACPTAGEKWSVKVSGHRSTRGLVAGAGPPAGRRRHLARRVGWRTAGGDGGGRSRRDAWRRRPAAGWPAGGWPGGAPGRRRPPSGAASRGCNGRPGAGGPGRSGGAPRPCRWPCRPRSGSPRGSPCRPGRGRAPRGPRARPGRGPGRR